MSFFSRRRIVSILVSPWFLALPVAAAGIFLLPDIFGKYRTALIDSGFIDKTDGFEYYADIDRDGNSERIIVFNNTEGKASIKIFNPAGDIRSQHYFNGRIVPKEETFASGPVDSKGNIGLILFTLRNDSLLMNGMLPSDHDRLLFRDVPITTVSEKNGHFDYSFPGIQFHDLDLDGSNEIISGQLAGFSFQPRFLCIYNIKSGELIKSPPMGSFSSLAEITDLNGDGYPEILTHGYAIGNCPDSVHNIPFRDKSCWLLAFDRRLNLLFQPPEFKGEYGAVYTKVFNNSGERLIAGLYYSKKRNSGPPKLLLFSAAGKLLKSKIIGDTLKPRIYSLHVSGKNKEHLWLVRDNGDIEEYDHNLEIIRKKNIPSLPGACFQSLDIDNDGIDELLFPSVNSYKPVITRNDFSDPVPVDQQKPGLGFRYFLCRKPGTSNLLVVRSGDILTRYSYERNFRHYLQVPAYVAIYLVSLGFILLIQFLQRRTLRQKYDAEKKISEMQLLLIGNQLDPHFTFNALNSISSAILEEKPEKANRILLSLSRLMRTNVIHADKISRTLAEELDFLQNYLELVRDRMAGSFDYRFEIDESVDLNWQVLKMIAEIPAENAIKHGLKPLKEKGLLIIRASRDRDRFILEIEDNGVGRRQAALNGSQGTGKGVQMMEQTIALVNRYSPKKILTETTDLEDEQGNPLGTQVRISIPIEMNYRFLGR